MLDGCVYSLGQLIHLINLIMYFHLFDKKKSKVAYCIQIQVNENSEYGPWWCHSHLWSGVKEKSIVLFLLITHSLVQDLYIPVHVSLCPAMHVLSSVWSMFAPVHVLSLFWSLTDWQGRWPCLPEPVSNHLLPLASLASHSFHALPGSTLLDSLSCLT